MSVKPYHASIKESNKSLKTKSGKIWGLIANQVKAFKSFLKRAKKKKHDAQIILPSESKRLIPASVKQTLKTEPFKLGDAREILPSDVITEILHRLPPKSLIKLQLVCKDWKSIIYSPQFMEKYRDDSAIATYIYHIVGQVKPGTFTIIHSRYGLRLEQSLDDHSYCLWNPAIHQLLQLPNPQKHSYGFALCYISATKRYKLISFYKDGDFEACEVFVPGCSKAWKRITSFPVTAQVIGDRSVKEKKVLVVESGEYVHCVRIFKVGAKTCGEIVSMDVGTESFIVTSLPQGLFRDWMKVQALDWNGKLGFCDILKENLEVMVLEDCKKQKWGGNKKIIQLPFIKNKNYGEEGSLIPLFAKNGDIWFQDLGLNREKVFTYTMDTTKVTIKSTSPAFPKKFFTYNPSMVSFEGMQLDTKLHRPKPCSMN